MDCPSCKAEIPDGSKFCIQCGAPLPLACSSCRHSNPPHAKFCANCGASLTIGSPPTPPISSAERRHLTVMFCDLVGSTALSVRLDPEDLREVIAVYHRYVAETVTRFGGFVARYMGDGVLVYFGYPLAHEHDAERAVRAGLELLRALSERGWPSDVEPKLRIGIATGLVIVGDLIGEGVAQEHSVIGETPNLAARLQALAEPNTVMIESNTRRLTGGLFDYQDLGSVALRGFAEPVLVTQVMGLSTAASRFEALHEAGMAPLLGRDQELELLLRHWHQAKSGRGRVALLSGEPGIGKSRLTAALPERIAAEPYMRLRYFCSPDHRDSALHPIIAQLERSAEFARDDDPSSKLDKLQALLSHRSTSSEDASLIADLLSLADIDRRYPRLDLAPQQRKQKTLAALWRQVETLSRRQPLLMIFEDVQWIDPTSLDLLNHIIEQAPRFPVMLLVTCRPDFDAPWMGQPQVHLLVLNRLTRSTGAALVGRIAGSDALSREMVEEIVERTDGVPLFIEELTKAVVEASAAEARSTASTIASLPHHIPATLHASLTSRLDRLGPAKELAQVGAVIGRRFSYHLLAAVTGHRESELRALLDQLTATGLVFQQGTPPQATFLFKHALVQDVAYGSLLRPTRQQLHARIATTLEAEFPGTAPELLAQHWAQAGDAERAVTNWQNAGKQAIQRCANREAIALLTKGLRMLDRLPHRTERDRTELGLQLLLAEALMADKGWTAPEILACYARARELCDRIGDTAALFPVLYGQFSHYLSRGESDAAHGIALQTLQRSEATEDPALLSVARCILGMSFFSRGEPITARVHLQASLTFHQPDRHSHTFLAPSHNYTIASMWLGLSLLLLGYPRQASVRIGAGLRAVRELSNPHTLAHALALACRYNSVLGDVVALREAAEELAAVAAEHEFPFYRAIATIYRGWVLTGSHDIAHGIDLLRAGVAAFLDLGAAALRPYFWARIALLSAAADSAPNSIELLDEALEQVEQSGQRWCEAELDRSKGELLSRFSDALHAEACLQRSLMTARRQHAKLWELRAACSLGRLWRNQGKHNEARTLLAPIYGWFTEGFDAPDLREAKALLDELRD
jgi:class 3 adenylate cyclase/predicted ATPase